MDEAQKVLDAYHNGSATVLGTMKNGAVLVQFAGVTGYNNNVKMNVANEPTNRFMIKGTTAVSVVPVSPTATPTGTP
jgi:hypothetical protein